MSTPNTRRTRPRNSDAISALYTGLALTAAVTLAPLIDVATVDTVTDHVRDAYPQWPADLVAGDRNAIVLYLSVVGLLGAAGWVWAIRTVTRGRRAARLVTTLMFVLGASAALLHLTFSEPAAAYDRVIPPRYALLGLLPCLAGLVALISVWRPAPSPEDEGTRHDPTR